MHEKINLSDYKFIPRNPYTAREIQEYCMNIGGWTEVKSPPSAVYAVVQKNDSSRHIVIYENDICFVGKSEIGALFRKTDMQNDEEHITAWDKATPTCGELNFNYMVVGSDKVVSDGSEKRMIVTAAVMAPWHMEELIGMNVTDARQMQAAHIRQVGKYLTGISTQDAWKMFESGEKNIVSESSFVKFRSRIITKTECEDIWRAENEREKNELLSAFHVEVLSPMIEMCKPDYVVVDNFMEADKKAQENFYEMLGMEKKRIFLRHKAAEVNMATACASVISAYLDEIYMEWLMQGRR